MNNRTMRGDTKNNAAAGWYSENRAKKMCRPTGVEGGGWWLHLEQLKELTFE